LTAAAQDCCLTSSLDRMYSVGRQHRRPTTVAQVTVVPVLFTLDQCVWFVKKVVGVVSAETRGSLGRSGRGRGSWSLESRGGAASPLSTSQGLWERCKLRSGDWGKPTAAQSFSGILLLRKHIQTFGILVYYRSRQVDPLDQYFRSPIQCGSTPKSPPGKPRVL